MQIVEKSGEGLSRLYGVTVPASELKARYEARVAEMAPRMNIKGFRPGKVPPAHVKRMFGKNLMQEVVEQALSESSQKVLEDNNLRPAGQPELTPSFDQERILTGDVDLAYDMAVEVMPEFTPVDVSTLELTRPVYVPEDAEVDEALTELAAQNRTYEDKAEGAAADTGDMVVIDFVGRTDGEAFAGGSATDHELVLGSGQFIPGFEDQLVGVKAGDSKTVSVSFPEDYGHEGLKGKAAEFEVTVKAVRAPAETEGADDALAQRLGLSDLEGLKAAIRSNLEGQYGRTSRFKLKRALLDALDTAHDFPLPPRMVDAEFETIWAQVQSDKSQGNLPPEDAEKSEEQLTSEYRKIAERRVRLGLVLAEIGRTQNVQITEQELLRAMQQEAMRYGDQAQQMFDLMRNNPQVQAQLRAPIYEDKVVDLILEKAKVTDAPVSKDALMADDEMPEGYGE